MMKEECLNINELYARNCDFIRTLNIEDEIKDSILMINDKLYKLSTTSFNLKKVASIYIENINQNTTDILIDCLISLLYDYELCTSKPTYLDKDFHNYRDNELIIIKNYSKNEKKLLINELKENALFHNDFLIITTESKFEDNFFDFEKLNSQIVLRIKGRDYSNEEILIKLKNKLEVNKIKYHISDVKWQEIIAYALNNKECLSSNCVDYLYQKCVKAKVLEDVDIIDEHYFKVDKPKPEVNLDNLIGLANVKKEIKTLESYLAMQKRIGQRVGNNYLNMMFLGNPGTGKTTVGKIYAHILYSLGLIENDKVVEIIPTDLMANYVGQTKDQTRKILNKAKGGVLFIDEAYLICQETYADGFASYMSEAVVELIKYMEDAKNVVIFAGYPRETKKIYDTNPGIKSRICKEIIFEDYSEEELLEILKNNLKDIGFKISKKGLISLKEIIKKEKQKKNFGNARFCNVLMQQLLMNYASRVKENDTYEITSEDAFLNDETKFTIGFKEEI